MSKIDYLKGVLYRLFFLAAIALAAKGVQLIYSYFGILGLVVPAYMLTGYWIGRNTVEEKYSERRHVLEGYFLTIFLWLPVALYYGVVHDAGGEEQ